MDLCPVVAVFCNGVPIKEIYSGKAMIWPDPWWDHWEDCGPRYGDWENVWRNTWKPRQPIMAPIGGTLAEVQAAVYAHTLLLNAGGHPTLSPAPPGYGPVRLAQSKGG